MSLKVLLLSHRFYPDLGGIETITEFLADSFSKAGHEVHLLTWSKDKTGKTFPFAVIRDPGYRKLFQEHRWADIVFENNPCMRLSWPGFFFDRPNIIGLHTWISRTNGNISWQDQFKFRWLKRAKQVIACSDIIRSKCWPEALVIGNPYRDDSFQILPGISRTHDFVFVGRLVSDKGADLAIKTFHILFNKKNERKEFYSKPTLTIIGDGPERTRLQNMVSEFGLDKHIIFKGSLHGSDLVKCLNLHRFILVPSRWEEPFGIVALEGMACGCIPIVSDRGGLPAVVGDAGLIFKTADVNSFASAIDQVLNDPLLEQKLRDAAPARLLRHQQNVISKQYLDVLNNSVENFSLAL